MFVLLGVVGLRPVEVSLRRSSWSIAPEVAGTALVEVGRKVLPLSCMLSCEH